MQSLLKLTTVLESFAVDSMMLFRLGAKICQWHGRNSLDIIDSQKSVRQMEHSASINRSQMAGGILGLKLDFIKFRRLESKSPAKVMTSSVLFDTFANSFLSLSDSFRSCHCRCKILLESFVAIFLIFLKCLISSIQKPRSRRGRWPSRPLALNSYVIHFSGTYCGLLLARECSGIKKKSAQNYGGNS